MKKNIEIAARLPDFIIAGAQKSGTTSLQYHLTNHPDIFMPAGKRSQQDQEIHFFDDDENFAQGIEWYSAQLAGYKNEKLLGETTPSYMYLDYVPQRIFNLLPNAKLFFILRNPVDRAYSHYWHVWKKNRENFSFEKGLQLEEKRIGKNYWNQRNFSYASRGFYYSQISRFLKFFPKENMHIIIFENFKKNTLEELNKCFNFLGANSLNNLSLSGENFNKTLIPRSRFFNKIANSKRSPQFLKRINKKLNLLSRYPPMNKSTRSDLLKIFHPQIKMLEDEFSLDLSEWYL